MHNLNEPRNHLSACRQCIQHLAMSMMFTINGADTFWFLPPLGNPDPQAAPSSSYFVYDNQFFPLDLYDGTRVGVLRMI